MNCVEALRGLCNAMASSFYPDEAAMEVVLYNEGINPTDEAKPKDKAILMAAITLVMGYVESSRSDNGVSVSVREEAIKGSIRHWCSIYGVDAEDAMMGYDRVMSDGSNLW